MKKNVIALMLTIVMLVGSIGGSSAFAAEAMDESSTMEVAVEETAGEDLAVPETADEEADIREEQEELSEVTGPEQTEAVQDDAPNSEEVEDSTEAGTKETLEPATEEFSFQEEAEEIIDEDAQEQDEENREAEADSSSNGNVAQAIWTFNGGTLTFFYGPLVKAGDRFNNKIVTQVWSGTDVTDSSSFGPEWNDTIKERAEYVIFDTSFLEVRPTCTCKWFDDLNNLKSIDFSGLDTSNVTDMEAMFRNCERLSSLDVSRFDTSNVIVFSRMFIGCTGLTELDISGFDTSSAFYMDYMFYMCRGLKSLDVSGFDTSHVENMEGMFADCISLTELDVSGFNTSHVENMQYMFNYCRSLTELDVSNFDLTNVTDDDGLIGMFSNCSNLQTIYCADSTTNWSKYFDKDIRFLFSVGYDMFSNCTSLVGRDGAIQVAYESGIDNFEGAYSRNEYYEYYCDEFDKQDEDDFNRWYDYFIKQAIPGARAASLGGYFTPKGTSSANDVAQAIWTKDNVTLTFYYGPQVSVGEVFRGRTVTNVWSGASVTGSGDTAPVWNNADTADCSCVVFDTGFLKVKPTSTACWFSGFQNLSNIDLNGLNTSKVTDMGKMFENCSSLTSLDLCSFNTPKVTKMDGMFYNCSSLVTILCADSATDWSKIKGKEMFKGCIGLVGNDRRNLGVYQTVYDGARVDAIMAKSASLGGYFSTKESELHLNQLFASVLPVKLVNAECNFRSELKKGDSIAYTFDYDDSWIFSDNESDLYKLLKTSIRVALAAFGAKEDNDFGPVNIKNMMNKMGFKYLKTSVVYPEPTEVDYNTIGSAIGLKNIMMQDGSTRSIILVAVRGGGYGAEWGGNFNVGPRTREDSNGFRNAANQVDKRLMAFIKGNKKYISDNLRIWIVGYSRAGATSNLVAADLINGKVQIDGVNPSDVRAFCFEAPNTTTSTDAHSSKYDNIITIANPIDFVPKVPLNKWNFTRYGQTLYIPYHGMGKVYYRTKEVMKSKYKNIFLYNDLPYDQRVYYESQETDLYAHEEQSYMLDTFCNYVGTCIPRNKYVDDLEVTIAEFAASALGETGDFDLSQTVKHIIELLKVGVKIGAKRPALTNEIIDLFQGSPSGSGVYAHYGELCMSWIDSFSSFEEFLDSDEYTYIKVTINCPIDVTVYDRDGSVIGFIENNEIKAIENGIVAMIDDDGQKVLYLSVDEEYTIEMKATDEGEVNYSVQKYNSDSNTTEKVINYKSIGLNEGEVLFGTANEAAEEDEKKYTLQRDNDGIMIEPDEVLTGDEVVEYAIDVSSYGNGTVTGGGLYIKGEFAKVTATADEGYEFEGWYVDGERVSEEPEYRFAVENDIKLEARFSKKVVDFRGKTTRGDMFNLANNVKVTWKEVPGARYYKVYREGVTDKKETRTEPVIVTSGLVGWDKDPGLTNGHAYRYRIVASLTGKGDPSGDSPLSYSKLMYRLKTVVIRSVKNTAPGKVTVKYDKTTSGDSYVLQYSTSKDMTGAKTKVVLGANNTSYVIGGLKKGKTYYISIRVRKKVNGIDYYTTFGVPKKITITK